jgi:hypothetical protein
MGNTPKDLTGLKKRIFFEMLDLAGRVFVLVRHSDNVVIGKRGFLPGEKENGLVLVFNKKMNFEWDEPGISAKLVFGRASENCFIPNEDILSIFSPELLAQFTVSPDEEKITEPAASQTTEPGRETARQKVVKVDFKKKKK